jgi:glycine cleavage system H protein
MYPKELKYSKDHEWLRVEDGVATVGVTQFAQEELGEVVFVEVPDVGQSFAAHDEIGSVESVKAVAEVYTPVSGEVTEVNGALADRPELINEDPHGDGWIVRFKLSDEAELEELMSAEDYEAFVASGE